MRCRRDRKGFVDVSKIRGTEDDVVVDVSRLVICSCVNENF